MTSNIELPPLCNTGVTQPSYVYAPKFDAYRCSCLKSDASEIVADILRAMPHLSVFDANSGKGYDRACALRPSETAEAAAIIMWAGYHDYPNVEAKGHATPLLVHILRNRHEHQVSRIDVALDFRHQHYDQVSRYIADIPVRSSRTSRLFRRLYEKAKQITPDDPGNFDLIRWEVEYKPQKRAEKIAAASMSAEEVLALCPVTRRLLHEWSPQNLTDRPVWEGEQVENSTERKWMNLARSYGPFMRDQAAQLGQAHVLEKISEILSPADSSTSPEPATTGV